MRKPETHSIKTARPSNMALLFVMLVAGHTFLARAQSDSERFSIQPSGGPNGMAGAVGGRPESSQKISSGAGGTVVDATTSQPVRQAIVIAVPLNGKQGDVRGAKTDANGHFLIMDLTPGLYELKAERPGFIQHGSMRVGAEEIRSIAVGQGQTPDVLLQLTPQAAVAGHITDANGSPLAQAIVQLTQLRLLNGHVIKVPIAQTVTNDLGEYRIFGVVAGQYYVGGFYRDDAGVLGLREHVPQNGASDPFQTEDYVLTWYPGVRSSEDAAAVTLKAGQTTRDVDIQVQTATSASVRGAISGLPREAGPIDVILQPADSNGLGPHQVFTLPSGATQFEFKSVPQGRHVLLAQFQVADQQWSARQELYIGEAPVVYAVLQLKPPFQVLGKVRLDHDGPIPDGLTLRLNGTDRPQRVELQVHPDGRFVTPAMLLPDNYALVVKDPSGSLYLRSISVNGKEVVGETVPLDQEPRSLEILVSDNSSQIDGVATENQNPVSRGLIVLAAMTGDSAYFSAVDKQGRYRITGVRPGSYRIACFSDLGQEQDATPDTLKKVRTQGERVDIHDRKQVIDLQATKTD